MGDIVLEFNHVWKKFRKGEKYDSLRDLIPAMAKRIFLGNNNDGLQEKEFWAIRDVSFQVRRGEALGIIGPNGAGKSTVLKLLSNILRANKGDIKIIGRISGLIEIGAGFHQDLTGRENIYLNGAILGMEKREINRKFDEIVEFSGLKEFIDTPVKRYSSGMNARLGFSVAAHINPDILLVDEVLSVGDWGFQRKCIEKMKSHIRDGVTIIFVSHNMQAVSILCPRALLLDRGSVVVSGQTKLVVRKYFKDNERQISKSSLRERVFIKEVKVFDENNKPASHFEAGEKAKISIEIVSRCDENEISVGVNLLDQNHYSVFNTSSERLGHGLFPIAKGDSLNLSFDIWLHLAQGTYYLDAFVKRYDFEKDLDTKYHAATITVDSDVGVRGTANLYPIFKIND